MNEEKKMKEQAWLLQQLLEYTHKELQLKEELHRKELEDQKKKFMNEEKTQEAMLEKRKLMSQIKQDIEPDILKANEIAYSLGKNISFSVQFTAVNQDEGSQFGGDVGEIL